MREIETTSLHNKLAPNWRQFDRKYGAALSRRVTGAAGRGIR